MNKLNIRNVFTEGILAVTLGAQTEDGTMVGKPLQAKAVTADAFIEVSRNSRRLMVDLSFFFMIQFINCYSLIVINYPFNRYPLLEIR